jgi:hypothetical protein
MCQRYRRYCPEEKVVSGLRPRDWGNWAAANDGVYGRVLLFAQIDQDDSNLFVQ